MCRRKDGVLTQLRGCFRPRGKGPAVRPHPVRLVPRPADDMVAKGDLQTITCSPASIRFTHYLPI